MRVLCGSADDILHLADWLLSLLGEGYFLSNTRVRLRVKAAGTPGDLLIINHQSIPSSGTCDEMVSDNQNVLI